MSSQNSKKYRKYIVGGRSRWYYLICGVIVSFIITIPVFLILSLSVAITDFPEQYISPAVFATMIVSILSSSFYSTAGSKNSGWANGCLVGLIYAIIITVIRWILESRIYINKDICTIILAGLLLGTVGGMAGINITIKLRKYKSKGQKL